MENKTILCSDCFEDFGLKEMAKRIGVRDNSSCPTCHSHLGRKMDMERVQKLVSEYFVSGSYIHTEYGGSPRIMASDCGNKCDFSATSQLDHDISLIEGVAGITLFLYGPAMWRIGITEWMSRFTSRNRRTRERAVREAVSRCKTRVISSNSHFFRIRTNMNESISSKDFDAPVKQVLHKGRFNLIDNVVFYASFEVETCLHECRVSMEDELFIATLRPCRPLRLVDLSSVSNLETEPTAFERLELAINQIFSAGKHSYHITRSFSKVIKELGYDGIIYTSYFNRVRKKPYKNLALFGRVVQDKTVQIVSIDRLLLDRVTYKYSFGPAAC